MQVDLGLAILPAANIVETGRSSALRSILRRVRDFIYFVTPTNQALRKKDAFTRSPKEYGMERGRGRGGVERLSS